MLLEVNAICKRYARPILDNVSFTIEKGESVGLVGESGSGKSTLARIISGIEKPDQGDILLNGKTLYQREHRAKEISIVFQDYTTSVNPTMTVYAMISEPLLLQGYLPKALLKENVAGLLKKVGLSPDLMGRYLYELSGGQAQRVCIARALATHPSLIILDEAISSLDLPAQVQILDLLEKLQEEFGMSYFFITHDIQTLCYFCDRVLFFQQPKIVAACEIHELSKMTHPYVKQLLNAVI